MDAASVSLCWFLGAVSVVFSEMHSFVYMKQANTDWFACSDTRGVHVYCDTDWDSYKTHTHTHACMHARMHIHTLTRTATPTIKPPPASNHHQHQWSICQLSTSRTPPRIKSSGQMVASVHAIRGHMMDLAMQQYLCGLCNSAFSHKHCDTCKTRCSWIYWWYFTPCQLKTLVTKQCQTLPWRNQFHRHFV